MYMCTCSKEGRGSIDFVADRGKQCCLWLQPTHIQCTHVHGGDQEGWRDRWMDYAFMLIYMYAATSTLRCLPNTRFISLKEDNLSERSIPMFRG